MGYHCPAICHNTCYSIFMCLTFFLPYFCFAVGEGKQNQIDRLLNQKAKPNKQESSSNTDADTDTDAETDIDTYKYKAKKGTCEMQMQ